MNQGARPEGGLVHIVLNKEAGTPYAKQIAEAILALVRAGDLPTGARLPAERDLARDLGVDRMTVARAYASLAASGLLARHVGRGSFVAARPPVPVPLSPRETAGILWGSTFTAWSPGGPSGPAASLHAPAPASAINLSSHFPDPSLFPIRGFRAAIDTVIRREGARLFGYGSAGGYPPLRRLLVRWLHDRGVDVHEDQILVTNGSQQGIDLVARAVLEPGDRVAVENPTYTGAVQLFQSHGARVAGVPVDDQGMRPDRLEEVLSRGDVKLLYLIPNFQNPTTGTMGLERRRTLLEIAARRRLPILEDDFGGDLRFEGEEVPSLRSLDRSDSVIYVSTFAKKLLPGLRIGWLAGPREAVERLGAIKQITDWNTSLLLQAALYEFCRRGSLERHLRRTVVVYRERRDAMIEALRRYFPKETRWTRPQGGLVIWVTLPEGVGADEVALEAHGRGVLVGRGDLFYVDGGTHCNLRLVYAQASPDQIAKGIRILGQIVKHRTRGRREAGAGVAPESLPII